MRILVVDDSRAMQSIVRRGLQKAGYNHANIKTASDGHEALEIIKVWHPNLVISDWHMPNMSGMDLLNTINRQMLDVKVGFVTTESAPQRLQEARNAGALFIINKPFTDDDLVHAVVGVVAAQPTEQNPPAIADTTTENSALLAEEGETETSTTQQLQLPSSDLLAKMINEAAKFEVFTEEISAVKLPDMMMPCVLGLFEDNNHRSRAVIIMDLRAASILGAAVSGEESQTLRMNILRQTISPESLKGCRLILANAASVVSVRSTQRALTLRSVNVIPTSFQKLEQLYARRNVDRSDYEVAAATYGQGLMTIIAT